MQPGFEDLCNSLSMTDIIRLQTMLSAALVRRFEQKRALVFSDLVGSTAYFSKFGDEAGRKMQLRHVDLLQQAIKPSSGRVVDTAGDGVFLCFPSVDGAAAAMTELLSLIAIENATRSRDHQLVVRIGIHYGAVLTDGTQVTGDSVNYCSRVCASANPGEIRVTKDAFFAFTESRYRARSRILPLATLRGIEAPAELMVLDWRDRTLFPTRFSLETGEEFMLPDQDIVTFGRSAGKDGQPANDFVLRAKDDAQTLHISRWHFELRRQRDGYVIRSVSSSPTTLNSQLLQKGVEHRLAPGDCVRVGNVLSLTFKTSSEHDELTDGTDTALI